MNAEFNWWLLIVGLVVGAGLVWYVLMDARRREADLDATERPREAAWLSATLGDEGWDVPPEAVERLLVHHRAYLEAPPPDAVPADPGVGSPVPETLIETPGFTEAPDATPNPASPDSELAADDGVRLDA